MKKLTEKKSLLHIPRELCLSCLYWLTEDDDEPYELPECYNKGIQCCDDYLCHKREDCPIHILI